MVSRRKKFWGMFGGFLACAVILLLVLFWQACDTMPGGSPELQAWLRKQGGLLLAALLFLFLVLEQIWSWLDKSLLEPMTKLSQDLTIMVEADPNRTVDVAAGHWLEDLPDILQRLSDSLRQARQEISEAMATGAIKVEQLERVIKQLRIGVVVFDEEARILLYNVALQNLFRNDTQALGLGRSLYGLFARHPVETTLIQRLRKRESSPEEAREETRFFCTAANGGIHLDCTMSLLPRQENSQDILVMTVTEVTGKMAAVRRKDQMIRNALERFRSPLSIIRAAAENLVANPDMDRGDREQFHAIVKEEIITLSEWLDAIAQEAHLLASDHWILTDTHTDDLVHTLNRQLAKRGDMQVTLHGTPLWIHADAPMLLLVLETLVQRIVEKTGCEKLTLESLMGDTLVYLDLGWPGRPIDAGTVESWQQLTLFDSLDQPTLGEVMERHGGTLWSQPHRQEGRAILRLPVIASSRQCPPPPEAIPERPEFYDFTRRQSVRQLGRLAARSLANLTFVVFDTETTGLHPSRGDEIISLAGIRIVNGRILRGETFEQRINPGRPIPPASTRIHGITDAMVQDAPSIDQVLPLFKTFTAGAVLVAHNAAFDMRFLQLKEERCDVWFDNPVLDTLILSVYLHNECTDHTLDGIADRLGVPIRERHTAMGDALVTAEVFLRLLALLNTKGITSLGLALEASESMIKIRKQQAKANY